MSAEPAFRFRVKPCWRDMDARRHVNNAVYLTYLENAREAWWRAVVGDYDIFPFTLARVEFDYRAQATWRDEIVVALRVTRFGNSSFDLTYSLDTADGRHVADAKTVLVMMDAAHRRPEAIPAELRKRMEAAATPDVRS